MERQAKLPDVAAYAKCVAALNAVGSRKPALLVVGYSVLLRTSGDGSASSVQPQAADVLAAVRSKGLPIAVLACGLPAARLQALLDAHQLGPFRSLACSSSSSGAAAADLLTGLRSEAGAAFAGMLLLDSDVDAVRAANRAGMTAQLLKQGLTADALRQGLEAFEDRQLGDQGF